MSFLSRFRTQMSGWWHNVPMPAPDANAMPIFQSWHTFDLSCARWIPLDSILITSARQRPRDNVLGTHTARESRLVLVTWNVDAFSPVPEARISALISRIQSLVPAADIVFLQEVSRAALSELLATPWLRDSWYSSEADTTNWEEQSFASMTLLSKSRFGDARRTAGEAALGPVWRIKYPSRFGRDALCCDILLPPSGPSPSPTAPGAATATSASPSSPHLTRVRLINAHLDSLPVQPSLRPRQLSIIAANLRAAGRGLVAGDFNPVLPEDHTLVGTNRLVDAWTELHPSEPGFTWGVDGTEPFPPGRLDKVAMVGLEAYEIEVIPPGTLERHQDGVAWLKQEQEQEHDRPLPWSDHSGLRCSFGLMRTESTPMVCNSP